VGHGEGRDWAVLFKLVYFAGARLGTSQGTPGCLSGRPEQRKEAWAS